MGLADQKIDIDLGSRATTIDLGTLVGEDPWQEAIAQEEVPSGEAATP